MAPPLPLAKVFQDKIILALDKTPCGRCAEDHKLKNCPMSGPNNGWKGVVWRNVIQNDLGRQAADVFLKTHKDYAPLSPPAPAPISVQSTTMTGNNTANTGSIRRGPQAPPRQTQTPTPTYVNSNGHSDMFYTKATGSNKKQEPEDEGKPWSLPDEMRDRSKTLKIDTAKYPLRQNFFETTKGAILTNHFEYTVTDNTTFYEYKVLDLETKNRKKLKALITSAIDTWPCLKKNREVIATNSIDTIVSWKSLDSDLSEEAEGEDVENEPETKEWGPFIIPDGKNTLTVRVKRVKIINTHGIKSYAHAHPNYEQENFDDIARCLNIVISKSFNSKVHKLSSNKFFVKEARVELTDIQRGKRVSDSLEMIRGYFYNVKPGMGNIILNFNVSTSAVFRPVLLSDFLNGNVTFGDDKAAKIIKAKSVYVDLDRRDPDAKKQARLNSEDSRYWKVFELQSDGNIEDLKFRKKKTDGTGNFITKKDGTFEMEKNTTNVTDHLFSVFGKQPIRGRPAVNVGSYNHPVWYAQEHLRIVPYQPYTRPIPDDYTASMVKEACRSPELNRAYIEKEGLASLGFTPGNDAVAFNQRNDLPISLYPTMLQVPRLRLEFPRPEYTKRDRTQTTARPGSRWNFPREAATFLRVSPKNIKYAVIVTPACDKSSHRIYTNYFIEHVKKCGLQPAQFKGIDSGDLDPTLAATNKASLEAKLSQAKSQGVNLVVLILDRYDLDVYRNFKNAADRIFGMQCICLVENFDETPKFVTDLMLNVMMKLNLKLGGVNHGLSDVAERLKTTMVLGGDLIHPGTGAFPGTPSIASIVGSVDDYGGKCLGSMRLQDVWKKDREVMDADTVEAMVAERLEAWAAAHKRRLPDNIIYYRDGVSSGHYPKVQEIEVEAIHKAYASVCQSLSLKVQRVNLATIIVTKRHHTRFYPMGEADRDRFGKGNCLPGTCVDQLVTSPYYQDFYLQSHSGIQGTAKPTHYFVLNNNVPDLNLEAIRNLTHNLCFSYARSVTSVSYASPTYYADRLCERGRLYIRKYYNGDDEALIVDLRMLKANDEAANLSIRQGMFPTEPHVKGRVERGVEKDHAEVVRKNQIKRAYETIEKDFYGEDRVARNPWHDDIADTMFWM